MFRDSLVKFALFTNIAVNASCQQSTQPFSLYIEPVQTSYTAGDWVFIKVTMTNTSNHVIDCRSVFTAGTDLDFQYRVRDVEQRSKRKPEIHPETSPGSLQLCALAPSNSKTEQTAVSWMHDFSKPGQYLVQLSRGISDNDKDGVIKSNIITITVTPKKESN